MHDPLCPIISTTCIDGPHVLILQAAPGYYLCDVCQRECQCDLITAAHERGYKEAENLISSKIIQYGKDTHNPHDPRIPCQRCDIVAAYNYAAEIARGK